MAVRASPMGGRGVPAGGVTVDSGNGLPDSRTRAAPVWRKDGNVPTGSPYGVAGNGDGNAAGGFPIFTPRFTTRSGSFVTLEARAADLRERGSRRSARHSILGISYMFALTTSRRAILAVALAPAALGLLAASSTVSAAGIDGSGLGSPAADRHTVRAEGSDVLVRAWTEFDDTGAAITRSAISLDGEGWDAVGTVDTRLGLLAGRFDPLVEDGPALPPFLRAGSDRDDAGPGLWIVQTLTRPLSAYREAIAGAGGRVRAVLPPAAYVVEADAAGRDAIDRLGFVRWTGPMEPGFKLEPAVAERMAAGGLEAVGRDRYYLYLADADEVMQHRVADRLEAVGARVDQRRAGRRLVSATMTAEQLIEVLGWAEVLWVDRWSPVQLDMNNARAIGGANWVEDTAGFTGEGVRGEVLDAGFNLGHVDFASRPLIQHRPVGNNSHGAATSGIIYGDGTGNPEARGMLPDAQGIVIDTGDAFDFPGRYFRTEELLDEPYEAVIHSSSVGHNRTLNYTSISAEMDEMLFDLQIPHCQSQSNAGDRMSRPEAWAKNIISVGGVFHQNTLTRNDDSWSFGASIGPASDGRIKPDLCHFYDNIFTVTSGGSTAYTSGFGGTSGATPIVCGHVGIGVQMWAEGVFGNIVDPDGTVFDNRPKMATTKALMINSASPYDFSGGGDDLTRVHQGWGLPNVRRLYERALSTLVVNEDIVLDELQSTSWELIVPPGEQEFRATLTWADPAGAPFSSINRINDLSLMVVSPSGDVYHGNHGLLTGPWSTPGGSPDTIDTVENVFVEDPQPGVWTITVTAAEIGEDGHVETAQVDADFALVVSGIEPVFPGLLIVPASQPELVAADEATPLSIEVIEGDEQIVEESAAIRYRFDSSGDFQTAPMTALGDGTFEGFLPAPDCDDTVEYYFEVAGDGGALVTSPPQAPENVYAPLVGEIVVALADDFETDQGWTTEILGATGGAWERGVPVDADGVIYDPPTDSDGSGQAFVTENAEGLSDVDNGAVRLTSPLFDGTGDGFEIAYDYWLGLSIEDGDDVMLVEVNIGGLSAWRTVRVHDTSSTSAWRSEVITATDLAELSIQRTSTMRIRFTVNDDSPQSTVEGGLDAVMISAVGCFEEPGCDEDVAGDDGVIDVADLLAVLDDWGDCPACPTDIDGDGSVGLPDLLALLAAWGPCP